MHAPQAAAPAASMLEVAPQPSGISSPGLAEIPADREFRQLQERAALDRNFHPRPNDDGLRSPPPYLGIVVECTTECYMGMEEHGLQVVGLSPRGPGAIAGLRASQSGRAGRAEVNIFDYLRERFEDATHPPRDPSGTMSTEGDLIVAVNDIRVHGRADWEREIRNLKPGDTIYLTIIRPLGNRHHQTMKIAIKAGHPAMGVAQASTPMSDPNYDSGRFAY